MKKELIDRDKLRQEIQKLHRADLLILLERAIEHLPKTRLPEVFLNSIDFDKVIFNENKKIPKDFLPKIIKFHKSSLRGDYYEDFNVNSKNYMEMSTGTKNWISECNHLLHLCVKVSKVAHSSVDLRKGMSLLFELLWRIDDGSDEFIFFADEAGTWQVGVDWDDVLPVWFKCLSKTAAPDQFALKVVDIIKKFVEFDRKKFLAIAHKKATKKQRKALPDE